MGSTSEVNIDVLPYVDQDYAMPGVKELVDKMVEEEMKTFKPKKYLPPAPSDLKFENAIFLKQELQRIQSKQKLPPMDMKRYELPEPSQGQKMDVSAWKSSVENSRAQLESQATRLVNLELLQQYGAQAWLKHISELEAMEKAATEELNEVKRQIEELNKVRKSEQTEAGAKLVEMEGKWAQTVFKNFDIETACNQLEDEVEALSQQARSLGLPVPAFSE
eukprot:Colp12_sorted_trinity150504_noHs@21032